MTDIMSSLVRIPKGSDLDLTSGITAPFDDPVFTQKLSKHMPMLLELPMLAHVNLVGPPPMKRENC